MNPKEAGGNGEEQTQPGLVVDPIDEVGRQGQGNQQKPNDQAAPGNEAAQ